MERDFIYSGDEFFKIKSEKNYNCFIDKKKKDIKFFTITQNINQIKGENYESCK